MSFRYDLGNIVELIGTNLGLPEWGRSEQIAGRDTPLTGKTKQSYTAQQTYNPWQQTLPRDTSKVPYSPTGQVQGATSTSQPSYSTNNNDVNQQIDTAVTGRDNNLDAIKRRLDEARAQASGEISRAGNIKDDMMTYLQNRYGQLQTRLGEKETNALDRLDTEGTTLDRIYARAREQARRRVAGSELKNRMRARALNRLDSSSYDDVQTGNQSELVRTLSNLGGELADKWAGLNTRKTETGQYYDNLGDDLEMERNQLEQNAIRQYEAAVAQAQALERAGLGDYSEGVDKINNQLSSALDSINTYIQNKAFRQLELDATLGRYATAADSYQPINEQLAGLLNNNYRLGEAQNFSPEILAELSQETGMGLDQILAMIQGTRRPEDMLIA